ncbi:MFS transporter, partial [Agromyces albus]
MSRRASRSAGWEQTLLVCALIGTAQMTWGVVVPVLPVYVTAMHIPVAALGPIIAAFAIGRVVANIPAGLLLARVRPRPLLHIVLVALAIVTAATGFMQDPAWIVGFRLAAGVLGGAAVTVGFSVLLAGAPAAQRGRVVAVATVVQMGAAAAGAL